jgi:hypothetical protein
MWAFYTPPVHGRGGQTILILALALLPALAALHSRSFFSLDETLYTQVAREMLETRDFVVPTIDGKPWLEKPPLVYWLLAAAFGIFGWGFPAVLSVRVPASCLYEPPQNLVMTTSHLDVPKEADPRSQDPRTLGFALDWLALDPAPDSPERPHSVTRR